MLSTREYFDTFSAAPQLVSRVRLLPGSRRDKHDKSAATVQFCWVNPKQVRCGISTGCTTSFAFLIEPVGC